MSMTTRPLNLLNSGFIQSSYRSLLILRQLSLKKIKVEMESHIEKDTENDDESNLVGATCESGDSGPNMR